jgi:Peptidase A4 family
MGITSGVRGRLVKSTVAAGVLLAAAFVPASAGAAAAPDFGPHVVHHEDSGWSGYVVSGSPGEFTSISGSWTEPTVTCETTNDLFSPWLGLDGFGDSTVEQVGVETDCSSGQPQLAGWYELYPAAPVFWSNAVSQGDQINASVVYTGKTYSLTLTDSTKGWSHTGTGSVAGQNSSAEAVLESPTGSFPSFGKFTFTNLMVNGQPMGVYNPQPLGGGLGVTPFSGGSFSLTPGVTAGRSASHGD